MNLATFSPTLFFAAAFTLATILDPIWSATQREQAKSVIDLLVGDGKRLFANHFVVKADIYFHNGYYPSIFRQAARTDSHLTESAEEHEHHDHDEHEADHKREGERPGEPLKPEAAEHHDHAHEKAVADEPIDFLERFGRHFYVSTHSHMKNADAKELLPWFKISAELDPNRVETYTLAGFWLRTQLKKVDEAEQFLRQGWKANPNSYAIIFELGRLYETDRKDPQRARNLFDLALKKWDQQESKKSEPDLFIREQILGHLAETEYQLKDYSNCLKHLQLLEPISPEPEAIRKQIQDVKSKLGK